MKSIKLLSFVIGVCLICINGTETFAQSSEEKDKSAIRANVEQLAKGWNMKISFHRKAKESSSDSFALWLCFQNPIPVFPTYSNAVGKQL